MIGLPRFHPVRPRFASLAIAVVLVLGATYFARLLTAPAGPASTPTVATANLPAPIDDPAPPAGRFERLMVRYDGAIKAWNESLAASAANFIAATNLGTVYVGRARLTGDLADYSRALTAVGRALRVNPTYLPARQLRATILFAVHDFVGARDEARAILAGAPDQLQALATLGDASLELGDLQVARDSYAVIDGKAASPPVWSRLSHLAFIEGDLDRAIGLVQRAIDAMVDEPPSESTAFYQFQIGELYRARGETDAAAAAYQRALDDLPEYVPGMAGLARVREAQGRRDEAIALLKQATDRIPQPEMVSALGDLYALAGDALAAERSYALVDRIGAVARATGAAYNRQLVIFAADHDRDLPDALALARTELQVRKDIYGHDALAWVLFKSGDLAEAAAEAGAAMALGTPDPRIAYHAGMIAAAQGRNDDARRLLTRALAGAVALPPLQVPVAKAALAALGAEAVP
jgi:tetratricopeptide (TPR) repeat protein